MALFKSEKKVQVHNHIHTSGLLFFRGHFWAHFEGHVQEQIRLTIWRFAAEYHAWCKSTQGLQVLIWECRTVGWLGSAETETRDTLSPQWYKNKMECPTVNPSIHSQRKTVFRPELYCCDSHRLKTAAASEEQRCSYWKAKYNIHASYECSS